MDAAGLNSRDAVGDPYPEIVVANGSLWLLEHDGTLRWGPLNPPGFGYLGPVTIADFDGDGRAEIGVGRRLNYSVVEGYGHVRWTADAALDAAGCETWVLAGIETHVCVNQTAHDLLERGLAVHVAADAVSSRTERNRDLGLAKMAAAGAVDCYPSKAYLIRKTPKGEQTCLIDIEKIFRGQVPDVCLRDGDILAVGIDPDDPKAKPSPASP